MTIQEIGQEMATQSHRSTQYILFVIEADKRVFADPYENDGCERKEESDMCDKCEKALNESDDFDRDKYCEDCGDDCFYFYKIERAFDLEPGVFFTAKACEEHIRLNHYHYSNPKSYGISAWRNYEMQEVMQFLITNSGNKVPDHYR